MTTAADESTEEAGAEAAEEIAAAAGRAANADVVDVAVATEASSDIGAADDAALDFVEGVVATTMVVTTPQLQLLGLAANFFAARFAVLPLPAHRVRAPGLAAARRSNASALEGT